MRTTVRRFDGWLGRRYGIFEFSQNPGCILRLQVSTASRRLVLPGGVVERGEQVLLLHLWNERLPALAPGAPGLGWAKKFHSLFVNSLREIAGWLDDRPDLAGVRAIGGVTILMEIDDQGAGTRLVERLGFTVLDYASPLGRFGEFWENFYSWVMIWTYNPGSLPSRRFRHIQRKELWITIEEFRRRLGRRD